MNTDKSGNALGGRGSGEFQSTATKTNKTIREGKKD